MAGLDPHADDLSGGLPVQVFFDAAPVPNAQLEVFEKNAAGATVATTHGANGGGRAVLPVSPGHQYLIDAVRIERLEPAAPGDPVRVTSRAALTFAVPGG